MAKKVLPNAEDIERKQRAYLDEITFSQIDFALRSLVTMIDQGTIELAASFQRRDRWDKQKDSRLIESFLLNIPVPAIFIMRKKELGKYSVIDGQQRLRAIHSFFNNKFRLTDLKKWKDLEGLNYSDLQKLNLAGFLGDRPLRTHELKSSSEPAIYDVFERFNTGVVVLNDQEIRNAVYSSSPFNKLIKELGENPTFSKLVGIRNHKSVMWKNMQNCELVLRYFAIRKDGYLNFKHSSNEFLTAEMERNKEPDPFKLESYKEDFIKTMESIDVGLGDYAFRNPTRLSIFMPTIYESTVHAFDSLDPRLVEKHTIELRKNYLEMWNDNEFSSYVGSGTNTPAKLEGRIRMLDEMVHDTLAR